MENALGVVSWGALAIFAVWAVVCVLVPRFTGWRKRHRLLDEIETKYESLRSSRRELVYHIDWAVHNEERKKAADLEPEIERIDKEMKELEDRFHAVQSGKVEITKVA